MYVQAAELSNKSHNIQIETWLNQTLTHANISQYEKDQIRQEYTYYQNAQTAITTKQQTLATHPVTPGSVENKRVISAAFSVDERNAPSSVPKGSIIQYTADGKTRLYDTQSNELYFAVDSESENITTPSGAVIPATHLISVPSGSSIYTVGNNDYVTNQGTVILTVMHPATGTTVSAQTNTLAPSAVADNWVDWAESNSGNINLLSSTWQIPSNPLLTIYSDPSYANSNLIWNGIQPSGGNGILQPVTAFNYNQNNVPTWSEQWTGNVWFGLNGYYVTAQTGIVLQTGDHVIGTVVKLPWDQWWVSLYDLNSGHLIQNQTTLSTYFPSQDVQAVNTFEAYPYYASSYLNSQYDWFTKNPYSPSQIKYTDDMKPSDVTFYNLISYSNNLPTSYCWDENFNPLGHPTVKNLDIGITNLGFASIVQLHMNSASKPSHAITVVENPAGGGIISPNETLNIPYDYTGTIPFTITPNPGYLIDNVTVDGSSQGSISNYTFTNDRIDHTLVANFKQIPTSVEWNWATDGWGDWQHTWSFSGTQTGDNSEYGPVIVNDPVEGIHGEHGTNTNLDAGSTQSSVWKTFTDPSGTGWNTITFKGLMQATDTLGGRWMTIDINNNQVFGATALESPPGNGVPFEIKRSFNQSSAVTVKISNGQNPAWRPQFTMHFYSVTLSNEDTTTMNTMTAPASMAKTIFTIPDGSEWAGNNTTVTPIETTAGVNSSG
jgi:hypothetical protein